MGFLCKIANKYREINFLVHRYSLFYERDYKDIAFPTQRNCIEILNFLL